MERIYIRLPYESIVADGYGYGLMVKEDFLGRKLIGHGGSLLIYTAYMGYLRSEKLGVIIMSNSSGYLLSLIALYTLAHLIGFNGEELEFRKMERLYTRITGVYETYRGTMRLYVKRKGGTIAIEQRDRYREELIPLAPVKLEEGYALFHAYTLTGKIPVEFRVKRDKVEMIYERYKLTKVAET